MVVLSQCCSLRESGGGEILCQVGTTLDGSNGDVANNQQITVP